MANKPQKTDSHMFSIELKSKESMKSFKLQNNDENSVIFEGFLGELASLSFTEGIMFEINGSNGSLRMDFSSKELESLLPKKKSNQKKREE
jgi:hypothetical protein